jgi:MFS family permease
MEQTRLHLALVEKMGYPQVRKKSQPITYLYSWLTVIITSVIFCVQVSMNLNASLYANAVPLLSDEFGISAQAARVGQMIFLVSYAFGCELWAPWSEEFGRWPILQLSLCLVNSTSSCIHDNHVILTISLCFSSLANTLCSRT